MTPLTREIEIAGKTLKLSTGELARQAGGAMLVQYGDTVVLGTATLGDPMHEDATFMPLLVEYEEKFYAAGKIKGSRFIKREGRPADEAIVTARLIDRSIRPLFPEDMINDVQVVTTVLSFDGENDPDILALIAASGALSLSDVPWNGPLAAVRVVENGELIINATKAQREAGKLDAVVAGVADKIVMLEADGKEVLEDQLLKAVEVGQPVLRKIVSAISEMAATVGKSKQAPTLMKRNKEQETMLQEKAAGIFSKKISSATSKEQVAAAERDTAQEVFASLTDVEKEVISEAAVHNAVHDYHGRWTRERILGEGKRSDGRGLNQIRPLTMKVGILPRTHGSAVFQRGNTQILTTLTLGGPGDVQLIDTMEIEAKKHYIHYYNFPAYSVGEIKPNRGPGRREIGHGALAERALIPVLPERENWPYTMLVVSEVLESHGSSSMASASGSTLALMDGGVPLKRPVAGIAIGLFTQPSHEATAGKPLDYKIVTDIAGIEDEQGDMDLKVAGTSQGITAVQMDIKLGGITLAMLKDGLTAGKQARADILAEMAKVLAEPRKEMSKYAPRIVTMRVPVEKIGDLIGPKGKHINEIIEQTGVEIDIEDDGLVSITSNNPEMMEKAKEWVHTMTREIQPGERFDGKVTRIMDFGAFVELTPNVEGMVHISQFREERVNDIHDVVKVGDIIPVVVVEIDAMGRINLSHKAAITGKIDPPTPRLRRTGPPRSDRSRGGGPFRGPRPPR